MSKKLTTEEWILKAKAVHGDRYDYSKVEYINSKTKVCIICPEHGEFWLVANQHLLGKGCFECGKNKRSVSIKTQLEKCKKIHNNYYDYSLVSENVRTRDKIKIICPIHGEFEQILNNHLKGLGCSKCGHEHTASLQKTSLEEFINKCNKTHNNYYDYSITEYNGLRSNIQYICPKHGIITQNASDHVRGCGCPKCHKSKGERNIESYLIKNNIKYISQYSIEIDTSINSSGVADIDFYLPDYNLFIEYNGEQHYIVMDYFGGLLKFDRQLKRDLYVRSYCKLNNIKLIEIPYTELNNIETILKENII